MNQELVEAINNDAYDDVILNLNNDIDSIMYTLNQIQMKVYDTKEYFTGDVADSFRDKFDVYFNQFETIKQNLNTYVTDLVNIREMYNKIDTESSRQIETAAEDTTKATGNVDQPIEQNATIKDFTDYQ